MRLADGSPTSESQLPEINGCNEIGIVLVSAVDAPKERLAPAIILVDGAAAGAPLRGEVGPD